MPKNIALCFDGTWNKPIDETGNLIVRSEGAEDNPENTNIVKIKRLIDTNGQTVLYFNGVGTDWYDRFSGGLAGVGLSDRIKLGYQNLAEYFEPGDNLYLFGFSRGAYTARSLGGMIRKCGIIRPECLGNLDAAFDLYRQRDETPDSKEAVAFRKANSFETKIQFIGVWDTVGELGIPLSLFSHINKDLYGFHDTNLSAIVQNGFHAVAIDENRKQYAPTLWTNDPAPGQNIEQRWFIGAHANVGGGYSDDKLSDITLAWMCQKACQCGLKLTPFACNPNDYTGQIHDSYSEFLGCINWFYRMFYWRYYRPIKFGACCQTLDQSPLDRMTYDQKYSPRNLAKWGTVDTLVQYVQKAAAAIQGGK